MTSVLNINMLFILKKIVNQNYLKNSLFDEFFYYIL
jgi:hypothetical protein